MTTATTERQSETFEYDLTVGMSVMEGRGFYYPSDSVVASNGRLYVANRSVDGVDRGVRVTVCDIESEYYGTFGSSGEGDGQFIWVSGIVEDSQGRLFITDEYSSRVSIFDLDGNFLSRWGAAGNGDGELDGPSGIAVDSADAVYVSDTHNNRVQKFTASGIHLFTIGSEGSEVGRMESALRTSRRARRRRVCRGLGERPHPALHLERRIHHRIRLPRIRWRQTSQAVRSPS